jgi:uncharacterized protein (UPF0332 family)
MNGRDFLSLARTLTNQGTEPARRTAISRAYYAAFHVARDWLESLGFVFPDSDRSHAYLWLRLQNCGEAAVEDAGRDLQDLRSERNVADYDLHLPVTAVRAATAIQESTVIIRALDAANVEPTRSRIRDEVKRYERVVLGVVTWRP